MPSPRHLLAALVVAAAAAPSVAAACDPQLRVAYTDGSPEDRLTIRNVSQTPWALVELIFDLRDAAEPLVFDIGAGGPGYSVFLAPIGRDVVGAPTLSEDDRVLTVETRPIGPAESTVLYLDLDDLGATGGTYVSPDALQGARLRARFRRADGAGAEASGAFGDNAEASLSPPACV